MKVTFAEFRDWHDTAWPEGYIWSGDTLMPDGRDIYNAGGLNPEIGPSEIVDLSCFEGLELEDAPFADRQERNVASEIRKWRKARRETVVTVCLPKADLEGFRAMCTEKKWRLQ